MSACRARLDVAGQRAHSQEAAEKTNSLIRSTPALKSFILVYMLCWQWPVHTLVVGFLLSSSLALPVCLGILKRPLRRLGKHILIAPQA